jgi:hypothetical protein
MLISSKKYKYWRENIAIKQQTVEITLLWTFLNNYLTLDYLENVTYQEVHIIKFD